MLHSYSSKTHWKASSPPVLSLPIRDHRDRATSKGTLAFRVRNHRGELAPIHPEVLIVPDLEATMVSVGALHEKGVRLDLLSNPPVLRDGNDAFPVSTQVPRMFVLYALVDEQEEPYYTPHRAVDTDT